MTEQRCSSRKENVCDTYSPPLPALSDAGGIPQFLGHFASVNQDAKTTFRQQRSFGWYVPNLLTEPSQSCHTKMNYPGSRRSHTWFPPSGKRRGCDSFPERGEGLQMQRPKAHDLRRNPGRGASGRWGFEERALMMV